MERVFTCLIFAFLASCAFALDGVCERVKDGDTIVLKTETGTEDIRLNGIDAPEKSQVGGAASLDYLVQRILHKKIRVEGSKYDRYGRLLGTVYLGNENINLTMVQQGWAWDYVQYNAGAVYTKAEKEARAAKRGIWASPSSPLPPWEYRHPKTAEAELRAAEASGNADAANFLYWISNAGKTHNRKCKQFRENKGTGRYSNEPSGVDAKCCGGAVVRQGKIEAP